ncbi:MAG: hypothetical protein QOI60_533, partial [Actinomycetota bacterium]|nr:hypothetical protein [Actinomycetota bacterium]
MSHTPRDPMGQPTPLSEPVERRRFLKGAAVVGAGVAAGAVGAELL